MLKQNLRNFSIKLPLRQWRAGLPLLVLCLGGCVIVPVKVGPGPSPKISPDHQQTPVATATPSSAISKMESQVQQRINQIRQQNNLSSLDTNPELAAVARAYSQKMAAGDFFSHTGPDGSTPAERVRAVGIQYALLGENLFKSTNAPDPVNLAVEGWMNSPGHRENILQSGFTQTGIGIWREGNTYYITQLFMRSPSWRG